MKKIKESIGEKEYKKLMIYVRGVENLKPNTKQNFLRTFTILFYTGIRLNEVQKMQYSHIKELLDESQTIIPTTKKNKERKLFASENFKKELRKLFAFDKHTDFQDKVVQKKGHPRSSIGSTTYIQAVNKIIHEALGNRFSSHSFRQGIITDMAERGINTKVISQFVGHSNIQTTLGYIKPTDSTIEKSLIR